MADESVNPEVAAMQKLADGFDKLVRLPKEERDRVKDWASRAYKVDLDTSEVDRDDADRRIGHYL